MTNVDVTLPPLEGLPRTFPCPLCALGLDIRRSRSAKPYCVCNTCGIQLFFRGKKAIARLQDLVGREPAALAHAGVSVATFQVLERLRAQRGILASKRPLIFADEHLENAILGVEREIAQIEIRLDSIARGIPSDFDSTKTAAK
jgi:hypothetical protein